MANHDQHYSLVFLPTKGRPSREFRISVSALKKSLLVGALALGVVIFAVFVTLKGAFRVIDYGRLNDESTRQQMELQQLRFRYRHLEREIENLESRQRDIQRLLGKPEAAGPPTRGPSSYSLESRLDVLSDAVKRTSKDVNRLKFKYSKIPSIRPLYGPVSSSYGFRYHPVVGGFSFHQGIDIPGWTGAPVRVSADGIVVYSGSSRGFGQVVVVDHFSGYRTIYAHASRRVVKRGEVVRKGQVVVEVGSTGRSTGPHLHYEIRRHGHPIDPEPFLDLPLVEAHRWI